MKHFVAVAIAFLATGASADPSCKSRPTPVALNQKIIDCTIATGFANESDRKNLGVLEDGLVGDLEVGTFQVKNDTFKGTGTVANLIAINGELYIQTGVDLKNCGL